jgi:hypothetical protein
MRPTSRRADRTNDHFIVILLTRSPADLGQSVNGAPSTTGRKEGRSDLARLEGPPSSAAPKSPRCRKTLNLAAPVTDYYGGSTFCGAIEWWDEGAEPTPPYGKPRTGVLHRQVVNGDRAVVTCFAQLTGPRGVPCNANHPIPIFPACEKSSQCQAAILRVQPIQLRIKRPCWELWPSA